MVQVSLTRVAFNTSRKAREPREIFARCPSCGRYGWFGFRGVQHWSEQVAEKCGLPTSIRLWICEYCQTTISEPNLRR